MGRTARIFTGHVQGVGFRASTRTVAREFEVTGWVRNEPDGSVRVEAQGEDAEVERFLMALRERLGGYIRGEVERDAGEVPGERGFEIRY